MVQTRRAINSPQAFQSQQQGGDGIPQALLRVDNCIPPTVQTRGPVDSNYNDQKTTTDDSQSELTKLRISSAYEANLAILHCYDLFLPNLNNTPIDAFRHVDLYGIISRSWIKESPDLSLRWIRKLRHGLLGARHKNVHGTKCKPGVRLDSYNSYEIMALGAVIAGSVEDVLASTIEALNMLKETRMPAEETQNASN
ncbi:hypothetical protein LguiB_026662 [Lonicera macranthoides]